MAIQKRAKMAKETMSYEEGLALDAQRKWDNPDIPRMHPIKRFALECWGRLQSWEMLMRQSFGQLRNMVRLGWSNDRNPVMPPPCKNITDEELTAHLKKILLAESKTKA